MASKLGKKSTSYAYDDSAVSQGSAKKAPFAIVEAYKSIRTNLMFMLAQENGGNIIAITSSNASEGKSVTTVNLAIAFSQLEDKVLVIDADMRRSSVHKKLKIENTKGLSNVLAGFEEFEDTVVSVSDTLDILTAGQIPPNPSELLGSQRFVQLLAKVREKYSYVIIDTPPINVVSDTLVIAPHTDGMVLVVRDGFTPHYTIKRAINLAEFANTKIIGTIMNGANPNYRGRYIYRKYSYRSRYYKYGYGKYGYKKYDEKETTTKSKFNLFKKNDK